MGRIKTRLIKRTTHELYDKHGSEFKDNFDDNKQKVMQYTDVKSKRLRNIIAGYMTRLIKTRKEA